MKLTRFEAMDAEDAELYAEQDRDGQVDGIYQDAGHVLSVRGPDGVVKRFNVAVEYDPTFYATEVP